MPTKRSGTTWTREKSGLWIPSGRITDVTQSSRQSYLDLKEKTAVVEDIYIEAGLAITGQSDLRRLLTESKALSDGWLLNDRNLSAKQAIKIAYADRVFDAIVAIRDTPNRATYLTHLLDGSLNLLERDRSKAKDTLWELELYRIFKLLSLNPKLIDPPDIVIDIDGVSAGIACKKLYSTKHVQNVLSDAVSQVEDKYTVGLVAVNLDDLLPANGCLRVPDYPAYNEFVNNWNMRFLHDHDRHFRKYLSSGRIVSVYVSTSVVADIFNASPRLNNARQATVWNIPGLAKEKEKLLFSLYEKMGHDL